MKFKQEKNLMRYPEFLKKNGCIGFVGHMADELGDIDAHRAAGLAGFVLAVHAALCFVHGHFFGVAKCNFLKVLVAHIGVLRGHGALLRVHIESHLILPPD